MKRNPRTPPADARACESSTSVRDSSRAHSSATFTGTVPPKRCSSAAPRQVDACGPREREGDVVGRERDPDHAQRSQPPDDQTVTGMQAPRARQTGLDHDLVAAGGQVPAGDDRVAAPAAVDDVDHALLEPVAGVPPAAPRVISVRYARAGEVRQRAHARVDARAILVCRSGR